MRFYVILNNRRIWQSSSARLSFLIKIGCVILRFNEFGLSEEILKGIKEMGFEEASPIQRECILPLLEGKDVIGQAQTGTGKTAAFGIPMLEMVTSEKKVQGLVLCPTRELSIQAADEISKLGKYKNVKVLPVYGGASFERQVRAIKGGVQIIVGTPGRIMDHMRRRILKFSDLKIAVLDEADEMFDMGFRDDMKTVLDATNEDRQTCFFSATMGREITEFSRKFQSNPIEIKIAHKELTVENIAQYYIELNESMKTEILSRIIDIYDPKLTIVFCNTKRRVDNLVTSLSSRGYNADGLHGDLRQNQRDNVMNKFRESNIDILVATDVAARGIDVGDVDVVVNFDIPQDEEYYVHRIGRTARAGRTGKAFSFVTGKDLNKLRTIIRYTKAEMQYMEIPTLYDMDAKNMDQLQGYIERELAKNEDLSKYRKIIDQLLVKNYTPTQISEVLIKSILEKQNKKSHEKLEQVDFGRKAKQKKTYASDSFDKNKKTGKSSRIFINKGLRDGLNEKLIVSLLMDNTNIPKNKIGSVILNKNFSFVQLPAEYINSAVSKLNGKRIHGKVLSVEVSDR